MKSTALAAVRRAAEHGVGFSRTYLGPTREDGLPGPADAETRRFPGPVSFCRDSLNDPFYSLGDANPLRILDSGLPMGHLFTPTQLATALAA